MQWFENENFWNNYAPIMYDDGRWEEAPAVADYTVKIANLNKGDAVLDAGCGLGRISVELAVLGMNVTGVDIIQSELDAAKEMAEAEGVSINFVNADLRTFQTQKKFDCAISMFTSIGYCDTKDEDIEIFHHIFDSLESGGTFIIESLSREIAKLYFTEGEEFERAGMTVKTHFEVVGDWEGLLSKWDRIKPDGTKMEHEFVQRLYGGNELCDILKSIGFSEAQVFGDFDFSPYDDTARTMVVVAKK